MAAEKYLIPRLVTRLVELVKSGEILYVAATTLTREGVLLSNQEANIPEPQLVPYLQLDCTIANGALVLSSRFNRQLSQTIDLAETWNAVLTHAIISGVMDQPQATAQA